MYKNNVPIWVIDAKSPRVKVDSRKNIEQISNYSNYIGCSNAILSNAKETILYKIYGSKVIVIDTFTLKAINNINKLIVISLNLLNYIRQTIMLIDLI